jgi:hypothetical protein
MGLWKIRRTKLGGGLAVVYVNRYTGAVFPCGEAAPEQSAQSVIDWACCASDAGDLILFEGLVLCRLPEQHERSLGDR